MCNGFIVLQRQIKDWQWWHNSTARALWVYILIEANWADGYNRDGTLIPRGSFARSLRNIAEETGVSINTVRHWLKEFEKANQIAVSTTHGYTIINVINYGKYQDRNCITDTPTDTLADTPTDTPTDTDITRKQENKKNNIYNGRFTPPTYEEIQAYCAERKNKVDPRMFLDFYTANGWTQGKGKKIRDWKACVRTWERNNVNKPKRKEVLPEGVQKTDTQRELYREIMGEYPDD